MLTLEGYNCFIKESRLHFYFTLYVNQSIKYSYWAGLKLKSRKIAVLLAAYNGEAFLGEQIDSILSQFGVDLDIYISIDRSSDNTLALCEEYSSKNENIHVLQPGGVFGSASANFFHLFFSVRFSDYDFVALSDQDDIWLPSKLYNALALMEKYNAKGYSSDDIAFWGEGKAVYVKKSYEQKKFDHYFESAGHGCTYVFEAKSFSKFVLEVGKNRSILRRIAQHDWLAYFYYRVNEIPWVIDSRPNMLYRQHAVNDFGVNSGFKGYFHRIKKVFGGWYREQIYLNFEALGLEKPKVVTSRFHALYAIESLRRRTRDTVALALFFIFFIY